MIDNLRIYQYNESHDAVSAGMLRPNIHNDEDNDEIIIVKIEDQNRIEYGDQYWKEDEELI
jgi:hypothetical protein